MAVASLAAQTLTVNNVDMEVMMYMVLVRQLHHNGLEDMVG